jgi:RNA polymerase sigma factor (sigma-70 family)
MRHKVAIAFAAGLYCPAMSEVSQILAAIDHGDPRAAEQLLPLVYDELRKLAAAKLAHEKPGQTLQATALVHEAYLRLAGNQGARSQEPGASQEVAQSPPAPGSRPLDPGSRSLAPGFDSRGHFFAAAAEAMRRILVEAARRKGRLKRGGDLAREPVEEEAISAPEIDDDLIELDAALDKLAAKDHRKAELVKLRYFAGLTIEQAAAALGISNTTADRDWSYARAWLYRELSRGGVRDGD